MQQYYTIHHKTYDILMQLEHQRHVQQMPCTNQMHLKHHQDIKSITIFF